MRLLLLALAAAAYGPTVSTAQQLVPRQGTPTRANSPTVETPTPTQAGMAANCDEFYYVVKGDRCDTIAPRYGITSAQIAAWNPAVGADCAGLWASVFICVSITGHEGRPPNAVGTPTPIIPGMTPDCDQFSPVREGDNCDTLAARWGVPLEKLKEWNAGLRQDCNKHLLLGFYVCVLEIGYTPKPEIHARVMNCRSFHAAKKGETCAAIEARYRIAHTDFVGLNPSIESKCGGLTRDAHVCVAALDKC
jgi:hypothetical protein